MEPLFAELGPSRRRAATTCTWPGTSPWPARQPHRPHAAHPRRRVRSPRQRARRRSRSPHVTPTRTPGVARRVEGTFAVPLLPDRRRLARQPVQHRRPTACRRATARYTAHFTCIVPTAALDARRPVPSSTATACSAAATRSTPATSSGHGRPTTTWSYCATDWIGMAEDDIPNARRHPAATCRRSRRWPTGPAGHPRTRCSSPGCCTDRRLRVRPGVPQRGGRAGDRPGRGVLRRQQPGRRSSAGASSPCRPT